MNAVRQQLGSVFNITAQSNVSHLIGLSVRYDLEERTLRIDQKEYIAGVLEKFQMQGAWPVTTSATEAINDMTARKDGVASAEEVHEYASLVRSLLWIAQGTRPDISFSVGRCARCVANPSSEHLAAAKRILRYLKGTIDVSLSACAPRGENLLTGWADSDWAGARDCRRSTSGYVFAVDGLVCSWSLKLQSTVANSSVEAEYVALAAAACELI